jgi:hypothetical protein
MLPIRLSVRLADDDGAPWPAATHVVFADDAGRDHRLTIAPGATDVELGAALRQIVAYELAARDADLAGKSPDERRGDFRVVDDQ